MEAQDIITTIRKLGEQMLILAELLETGKETPSPEKVAPKEDEPNSPKEPKAEEEKDGVALPRLEDVRTVLAEISRSGKTAQMKELLSRYGAAKLSDVKPEDYPGLLSAAKEIANA